MNTVARVALFLSTAVVGCSSERAPAPDPNVPQLLVPEFEALLDNGCVATRDSMIWFFDWSDVPNATDYHLVVEHVNASVPFRNVIIPATSYRVAEIAWTASQNGWQWKVSAKVDGEFRNWSEVRPFIVEPVGTDCP